MNRLVLVGDNPAAAMVAARLGWEVVSDLPASGDWVLVGFDEPAKRREVYLELAVAGCRFATLIDPSACVHESVVVGAGCLVLPGVVVNVDSHIGVNCVLGSGTSVDHDGKVGDHARLDAGCHLAGTVTVGEGAWLGSCVCVIPGRTIGAGARIEPGSAVVRDVPGLCRVGGVPARLLQGRGPAEGNPAG